MVLRVKLTPTRFPTNSLYTPMDNTPMHSISSVCRPLGRAGYVDQLLAAQMGIPLIGKNGSPDCISFGGLWILLIFGQLA